MNSKPVLVFDADGVIVDFGRVLNRELNHRLGRNIRYQDIWEHNLGYVYGISNEEMWSIAFQIYAEVGVSNLPAIRGAIRGLRQLEADFDCVIITSRVDSHREATDLWFRNRSIRARIFYSQGANNPYAGGDGRLTKYEIAKEQGVCCLVEDNPHEFVGWPSNSVEPICLARPWNRDLPKICPGIPRIGWRKLISHVRERYG